MSVQIKEDDLINIFKERMNELMTKTDQPSLNEVLSSTIEFYENYKIENVDTSFHDEDTLFFEYGIYDWQDGKGENFTISLIRQYIINPEIEMEIKRSQLHLVLYYNSKAFEMIEPYSCESVDFEDTNKFKENITNSEGFINASEKNFTSYDIFFVQPD